MLKLPESITLSQQGEQALQEALADVRAGRVEEYDDVESLIAGLHREAGSSHGDSS